MTQESPSGSYVHGYATASRTMATRTAENFADFFAPQLKPGMTVLDVGCGPGTISVGLAEAIAPGEFHGVDIGPSEVEQASKHASELGLSNTLFRTGDATDLPYEDEQFDGVFTSAALEHVPNPENAISEIHRVLKRGGLFGIKSGLVTNHVLLPRSREVDRLLEVYRAVWESNGGHPDFGTEQIALIDAAGFKDLYVTGFYERRAQSGDYASRIESPKFVAQATEIGVSDKQELHQLASDLRILESSGEIEERTHVTLVAWIEVLATKPST